MIRQMQEQDVAEVALIEREIFSSPWSEKSFWDAIQSEDNIYLVAVQEEKIVGYCGIWTSYETADLCNMAVAVAYRRHHLGKKLLSEAIRLSAERKVQIILLEVRESNQGAIGMYEKMGFRRIGVRKGYYDAPKEDAILMQYEVTVESRKKE